MSRFESLSRHAREQALRFPMTRVDPARRIEPFVLAGDLAVAISFNH
jgi:hypothetical protein